MNFNSLRYPCSFTEAQSYKITDFYRNFIQKTNKFYSLLHFIKNAYLCINVHSVLVHDVILNLIQLLPKLQCSYSLMDRISDSGSDGCGSIPHGSTNKTAASAAFGRAGEAAMAYRMGSCLDVRDEDADYAEETDDIVVWEFEVGEVGLVFCDECECSSVISNLSYKHSV